jgi:hypothetical protein
VESQKKQWNTAPKRKTKVAKKQEVQGKVGGAVQEGLKEVAVVEPAKIVAELSDIWILPTQLPLVIAGKLLGELYQQRRVELLFGDFKNFLEADVRNMAHLVSISTRFASKMYDSLQVYHGSKDAEGYPNRPDQSRRGFSMEVDFSTLEILRRHLEVISFLHPGAATVGDTTKLHDRNSLYDLAPPADVLFQRTYSARSKYEDQSKNPLNLVCTEFALCITLMLL